MYKTERICRLCLGVSESDFEIIDDTVKGILDALLLKIDVSLGREPVMCKSCAVTLQKSIDLLSTCQNTKDSLYPFGIGEELIANVDNIKEKKNAYDLGNAEYKSCRFCMQIVREGFYAPLNQLEEDLVGLKDALPKSIFELYVTATEEPVLCEFCHTSTRDHITYLKNSLEVERKIKSYYEVKEVDSKGQVDLYNVLQFTPAGDGIASADISVVKEETKSYWNEQDITSEILLKKDEDVDAVKQQPEAGVGYCDNMGHVVENHSAQIENGSQPIFYKCHTGSYDTTHKHYLFGQHDMQTENAEQQDITSEILLKKEEGVEALKQEPEVVNVVSCNNMAHVVENHSAQTENASQPIFYKCHTCSYDTTHKHYQFVQHDTQTENASQSLFYNCHVCSFTTTNKRYLFTHLAIHKKTEVYKCDSCSYETTNKIYFRRHAVVHKDISEIQMYKCNICEFQTRHKFYLNTHLLLHKDPSETTIYKCESCPYETKNEKNLKRHLLNHNDGPQYKCEHCSYITKHKVCFKRHSLTHKSPSEITMYKCEVCSYTTRHKKNYTLHTLRHKDDSEVTIYYCASCPYKARTKHNLKHHVITHKSNSEVKTYKCESCNYETKRYNNLRQHLIVHKKPSEIEMYRCDLCSYETKRKTNLKQHMLTHKKLPQVAMYKCEKCPYENKQKGSLKQHTLTHHRASDNDAEVGQVKDSTACMPNATVVSTDFII